MLRYVADELASWHARALKTESDLKEAHGQARGAAPARLDPEVRGRISDLEQENKHLKQRVEAARVRVGELLGRLTFLEDQARETAAGARGAGGGAAS